MPLIEEIPNNLIQNEYIKLISDKIDVDESALIREVNRSKMFKTVEKQEISGIVTKSSNIYEKAQKNLLSLFLTGVSSSDINYLQESIKYIKFIDKNLIIIKQTIDKLLYEVNNNVENLIQSLYIQFSEDNQLKDIITDLIYIADSFKNLAEKDFKAVMVATLFVDFARKIQQFHADNEKKEIISKYKNLSDDDVESMQYQMQLREKLKKQITIGE